MPQSIFFGLWGGAIITPIVLEYHVGSSDTADRLARSPAARSGLSVKIGGVRCSLMLGRQASPHPPRARASPSRPAWLGSMMHPHGPSLGSFKPVYDGYGNADLDADSDISRLVVAKRLGFNLPVSGHRCRHVYTHAADSFEVVEAREDKHALSCSCRVGPVWKGV